jgi:hypothetical protein
MSNVQWMVVERESLLGDSGVTRRGPSVFRLRFLQP